MPRKMAREPKNAAAQVELKTAAPTAPSEIARVLALLQRPEGATLTEMIETTGGLAHTTRAALTGLKKKGHVLEKSKRDDATCYRAVVEAS